VVTPTNPPSAQRRAADVRALEKVAQQLPADRMAAIRLHACLDAARRAGLTVGDLLAVAGRVGSSEPAGEDAELLAALDQNDLAALNLSAGEFILSYAAQFRNVAAVTRAAPTCTPARFRAAVEAMEGTAEALRECLHQLPDEDQLADIGRRLAHERHTWDDLALIRALPGPFLSANATAAHLPLFVGYRSGDR
jgi:hypothetical protein